MTRLAIILAAAFGAFVAVLLVLPNVWKREPEYEPFVEPYGDV